MVISRSVRVAVLCAAALLLPFYGAYAAAKAKAKVMDVSGHTYDVSSIRLTKGSKLQIVCDGVSMDVPFKSITAIKVDPARISSYGGNTHYSIEIQVRGGTVFGSAIEDGRGCTVCADNGFRGKTVSKSAYSVPFSKVSAIQILGKDAAQAAGSGDEGDGGEDGEDE
ncbi:MAG: hypothetical protein FWC23_04425 [Chitinispirillia bacterium]|nr:hypothetical protein [Chitinispirillia bacterium]MCL2268412.1 hypothetical protein [Chitinispirillia bacterium]